MVVPFETKICMQNARQAIVFFTLSSCRFFKWWFLCGAAFTRPILLILWALDDEWDPSSRQGWPHVASV